MPAAQAGAAQLPVSVTHGMQNGSRVVILIMAYGTYSRSLYFCNSNINNKNNLYFSSTFLTDA